MEYLRDEAEGRFEHPQHGLDFAAQKDRWKARGAAGAREAVEVDPLEPASPP